MFEELYLCHGFCILYGRYIIEFLILYLIFRYKFKRTPTTLVLSSSAIEKCILDFKPEPLVNRIETKYLNEPPFIDSKLIESADFDFYDLKDKNKKEMIDIVKEYGVGTCGPPGFYGTLDIHLELEAKISEILGTEASALYSNSFTCINSVITCFCRQQDNVFYHKDSNEAIIRALSILKIGSVSFSDLLDLEEKIKRYYENKKRNFIITEALFRNTGKIIDLPRLIAIKNKHRARLIIDESLSIPLLGSRGISEFFKTDITEIDVVIGSLAHVFCGNGGFASGNRFVTDYQRLSAKSYCFSASMPGFLAKNAILNISQTFPLINIQKFTDSFISEKYTIVSDEKSPMVIVRRLEDKFDGDSFKELRLLRGIKSGLLSKGIRVGIIENPYPSLRICIKQSFTENKITELAKIISEILNK